MKNKSRVLLWSLVWWFSVVWMLVFAENVPIMVDITNAVQHINSVKIKQVGNIGADVVISKSWSWLSQMQTESNILLGTTDNKVKGSYSTILGWMWNEITWQVDNTIIAWASNSIDVISNWEWNTILWGQRNEIVWYSAFSTIAGWENNVVSWNSSTIVWGKDNGIWWSRSVIVGTENSVTWNDSVAMWKKSKIQGNNSFLWTDSENDEVLTKDNVFAVVSRKWMVINSIAPNEHAQLTIGWPLVVSLNSNDQNAVCGSGEWLWTIRTVSWVGRYCLCNCDGTARNSMFWHWQCQSICNGESMQPVCGTGLYKRYIDGVYTFHWTCEVWESVEWTWAYLVDKNDIVHRTCQTEDWTRTECSSAVTGTGGGNCELGWQTIAHWNGITAYANPNPEWQCSWIRRVCNDGILGGSSEYQYATCSSNDWCKMPWSNEYISNGSNLRAYAESSVPFGSECVYEFRTCSNGSLNGSYTKQSCTVGGTPKCTFFDGSEHEHLSNLVTYKLNSTECPVWCNDADNVRVVRCYNGLWLRTDSWFWSSNTQLAPGVEPEDIVATEMNAPYPYRSCTSVNSSNESIYTLSQCPWNSVCSSWTVYYGVNNTYPGSSCSGEVKYGQNKCTSWYYRSWSACENCPTWYTSNPWATSQSECYIKCNTGQHVSTVWASSCSDCEAWLRKDPHAVGYGSTSSCVSCSNYIPNHSSYVGNNCEWQCDAGYYRDGNGCSLSTVTDLDMYFITDAWTQRHYTLMDRNLWATAYMDEPWKTTGDWYGSYYQWWNNYGFPNQWTVNTSTTRVNASEYGPNNYYSSDTFIKASSSPYKWDSSDNSNLWWNNGSESNRQWPCPDGYHVPTDNEFQGMIVNWEKSEYYTNTNIGSQWSLDFLMPRAGNRSNSSADLVNQGVGGHYWSSSRDSTNYAYYLRFGSASFSPQNASSRALGLSVRCFRNSPTPSLTLYPDWWKKAVITVHNGKIRKLWTPTKSWKTFWWWYSDAGFTSQVHEWDSVPSSAELYAKWN